MFDCENIMLVGLVAIIVIIIVLMYQKTEKQLSPSVSNNIIENFANDMDSNQFDVRGSGGNNYKEKYDELKKYMEIQGMYPVGTQQDMSKYVLKSEVAKENRCPHMSQYVLKSSVPPQTKCPH